MPLLSCEEILEAAGGKLIHGNLNDFFDGISTDSREIYPGSLFIPIEGERFDGHDFINAAFDAGAKGCLTHRPFISESGKIIIEVKNTLTALGDIAGFYRQKLDLPIIAVTGSVGKTTTKDMIASVLSTCFIVLQSEGNYNNEIGLPKTLLSIDERHDMAVVEMGMRGLNEISRLTTLARPHVAVITNIGLSHVGRLGSRENILKAKLEVLEGLDREGIVFLNADDDLLAPLKGKLPFKTVFFGRGGNADYKAYDIETRECGIHFKTCLWGKEYEIALNVPGAHNAINAAAAAAVGAEMGIAPEKIIEGLSNYRTEKLRLNIIEKNSIKILNDAYNACPESVKSAINVLGQMAVSRKIAVLGDMLELGEWAEDAHFEVGKFAAGIAPDYIIAVGTYAPHVAKGARETGTSAEVISFNGVDEALEFLKGMVKKGDGILIKGSRGMKMERIANEITGTEGI